MKLTLIGTYTPRKCGIATFTKNLSDAIEINDAADVNIIAMDDEGADYEYSERVIYRIRQSYQQDYIDAANYLNESDTDICIIQHEYGIFGGDNGLYILTLLHYIQMPVIVTVHTVLKKPSYLQKIIMQQIARSVHKLVVMSKLAVDFLKNIYEIPADKITIIEHGVPDTEGTSLMVKRELKAFADRKILFTFGLLSKNKGIETVIKALPSVIANHPDVLYVVLGNTHPSVLKHSGEEYRNYLISLAETLDVSNHVLFINRFVTDEELFTYLKNIEIYITPYLNEDQITSGTLSYAVGAGAACLSTPYWHAKELLDGGRGKLFPFKNAAVLSTMLNDLLDDNCKLKAIQKTALLYAEYIKWPRIGSRYLELSADAIKKKNNRRLRNSRPHEISNVPVFNMAHIKRLTDDTGIVQHAKYGIPNLKEGYCLDDNSRALIMILMSYNQHHNKEATELLPIYLSYIHYMQRDDGWFRNFLHFNRSYLDEIGSEDSFGRTIWALCYLIWDAPNNSYREFAHELFSRSFPVFKDLKHVRGIANTLIGICYYMKSYPSDEGMLAILNDLTNKLTDAFTKHSTENWYWFEDKMTYDNGILPLALLHSYEITGNTKVKKTAIQAIEFLKKKTLFKDYLMPIGNEGWCDKKDPKIAVFDQQAIEVMAMVLMFEQAYNVTKETKFLADMNTSFMWFLGKNELHIPLYDPETHGCSDGLEYNSINRNQGAESTLAYFISSLAVTKLNEKEKIQQQKNTNLPMRIQDFNNINELIKI
ncbi:glycosyltransferase [Panacibacter ginsenosidivorans]|uniref:Glycosyltransferase n=1 Tax=Panacibacter ginsenosidivorans TaxID=1813871 RepID=A0A5B8V623_9BACT|nr:glycosyltransferase family 4 protein [Panacibacter ginsenosidivorans]QEC66682.1 glycosyltransferase [Panacibacter ginsenosidivorans]